MPEIKENLGQQRKPLLNELRNYDRHGQNSWEIRQELNKLDTAQLGALSTFVKQGGWGDQLQANTLRILVESLDARLKVSEVYEGGEAKSPIAEASPAQALSPALAAATGPAPVVVEEAQGDAAQATETVGTAVEETSASVALVALAGRVPQVRKTAAVHSVVSSPRTRRDPLSEPKVQVARYSDRPAEGRGSRTIERRAQI